MASDAETDISSSVSKLSLGKPSAKKAQTKKPAVIAVADSWEDEDISSESDTGAKDNNDNKNNDNYDDDDDEEDDDSGPIPELGRDRDREALSSGASSRQKTGTAAPPPTPMSPTYDTRRPFSPTAATMPAAVASQILYDDASGSASEPKRPEKTDAVARRMIANALGMKVAKLTEEQRVYDRAVREKERRRKEEEKEREKKKAEEAAKLRQAVWED
ncbi:hypothetical protein B0T17DRAFT_615538 [Bombardia bombarda]|uniref:Uncharacterized protein n=1 Tax=Bombardia bombarda TaxID=252184 RepID=A0AA39X9Y4_9PEZI|nr:hypothetical protein B0T17DRAFT_615538 [Bombardia bombarda]